MKILLTNDDGIEAKGLRALYRSIPRSAEILVSAPLRPSSASGHSISLRRSIRAKEVKWERDRVAYAIEGTPVDCVKFAIAELKFHPDIIFSGVNLGPNTGVSVFYSGTVAAAREGLFTGFPAVAISMASHICRDFRPAIEFTRRFIEYYRIHPLPYGVMLNVNIPACPMHFIKGVKITRQAPSRFVEAFRHVAGTKLGAYELTGEISLLEPDGTSDEEAVAGGFISVTPLHVDLTAYHEMESLRRWYLTAEDTPGLFGVSGAVPARGFRPRAGGGQDGRPLTRSKKYRNGRIKIAGNPFKLH
ncbi:MAG: 5'/3'-nucleotidase SurE [Candidatus Omnitrophica bacterium]|nr:5'/3'-nucleotidase SurE [Candidatus Omnitrophota bacterium]